MTMREDERPPIVKCDVCGAFCTNHYYGCDRAPDLDWCPTCFPKTACGNGQHGEGCPTAVFGDGV